MTQVIDGEARALSIVSETVALPIPIDEAVRQWQQYQDLTRKLLDNTDYQNAGQGKRFKKKSAWRKYAKAFNLDDHVTFEQIERAPDGWPLWARIRVMASAPNGRTTEADHECHLSERCCPASWGGKCSKRGWDKHTCCEQDCNPRIHWSHPGDIAATALTRAKNRAISDLIGAGEVSAEEMTGQRNQPEERDDYDEQTQDGTDDPAPAMGAPTCGCGDPMEFKTGLNAKTGKPWRGWFCRKDWRGQGTKPAACEPRFQN